MDEQSLQGYLESPNRNPSAQARTLAYFEQLKNSVDGWKVCGQALLQGNASNDHSKFFCFQVLEHCAKKSFKGMTESDQQSLKQMLMSWLQQKSMSDVNAEKGFILNKGAQVIVLIFVNDYPEKWSSFFSDILSTLQLGPAAMDIFLRILKAIDQEIINREVQQSPKDIQRSTLIKDTMRVQCVNDLVEAWYKILSDPENVQAQVICLCLDVIGRYVSWIDINLIANDKFIRILLGHLSMDLLRESACDCLSEIINKGMLPVDKIELIQSLLRVLEDAGVLPPSETDDSDFQAKLAKLINTAGTQLIICWSKLTKAGSSDKADRTLSIIENKLNYMFGFLGNEDDDISQSVHSFARDYITLLKQIPNMSAEQEINIKGLLLTVIKKMKYDESYDFDQEGEDEAMFLEYRKLLKILFQNIGQLDPNLLLSTVMEVVSNRLRDWKSLDFMDVEVAIRTIYYVGEAIPNQQVYTDPARWEIMQNILSTLIKSNVISQTHFSVTILYFETLVRYDRFFAAQPQFIPEVLASFLDERCLGHSNCKVRSRGCYLLSRFMRNHKNQLQNFALDVLSRIQAILVVSPNNGYQNMFSADDQMFLYESAGLLIVFSGTTAEKQETDMRNVITPLITRFNAVFDKISCSNLDETSLLPYAQYLYNLASFASRLSKAFSTQQTMKQCGCASCFAEALPVFLRALTVRIHRDLIHSGVRQYLHRMIICLGEDILPYIPVAVTHLLKDPEAKDIQEFIPLINQIISKFKNHITPFLQEIFMPIVRTIFSVLNQPTDSLDTQATREKMSLKNSYFQFIASLVNNNIVEVILSQEPQNTQEVLMTIIHGAVEPADSSSQKACFGILKKLVEIWGNTDGPTAFQEFLYNHIIPSCFVAPSKPEFDLNDAQTILTLQEISSIQKILHQKQGGQFIHFLQSKYLPSLNLAPELIQEYCRHVEQADVKQFKNFLKAFFNSFKS
ncbi:exportin-T-like [Dendronephthya gigantea]|uniref:exportin-T-like n=1 Tax=Dendronephthya gigantea TaxID=151771 RepID=UPI00106D57C6|nr:exportin-T-like [Dendronephthya gigantea]